jgi:type VI secretion system secreted protein Hcp
MAYDAYLQIEGVTGDSKDSKHAKWIELYSFSWGASNPVNSSSGSGMASGKVSISSFNAMKKCDSGSAKLFEFCATGGHAAKAKVEICKSTGGATTEPFIVYEFEEVFVESIQWSGSAGGDDTPTESISVAFGKVTMHYSTQDEKGKLSKAGQFGWNLVENKKV